MVHNCAFPTCPRASTHYINFIIIIIVNAGCTQEILNGKYWKLLVQDGYMDK
jgi:hypothetical protein